MASSLSPPLAKISPANLEPLGRATFANLHPPAVHTPATPARGALTTTPPKTCRRQLTTNSEAHPVVEHKAPGSRPTRTGDPHTSGPRLSPFPGNPVPSLPPSPRHRSSWPAPGPPPTDPPRRSNYLQLRPSKQSSFSSQCCTSQRKLSHNSKQYPPRPDRPSAGSPTTPEPSCSARRRSPSQ